MTFINKTINLLPPTHQRQIAEERMATAAAIIATVIGLALMFFLLALFLIYIFYQYELKRAEVFLEEKRVIAQMSNVAAMESQIAAGNNLAVEIINFENQQTRITKIFSHVAECLPEGVMLSSFSFTQNKININGFSPNRDILALFKKNLESRDYFANIVFPASSWLSAKDIDFGATFEYK